jgi:hypothetical protein
MSEDIHFMRTKLQYLQAEIENLKDNSPSPDDFLVVLMVQRLQAQIYEIECEIDKLQ